MKRFSKPRQQNPGESAQQELFGLFIQRRDVLMSVGELYLKAEQKQMAWASFRDAAMAGREAAELLANAIQERIDNEKARIESMRGGEEHD
jgi:hypothetical protein